MVINNYEFTPLRESTVLTNSYVELPVLGSYTAAGALNGQPNLNNQLILYVHFTKGSLTTAEIKIEFSHDGTTWVQETYDDIAASTGVITERPITRSLSASGDYRIPMPINDQHIKVSVKGTGTVTSSLMAVDAIIGNV